MTQGESSEHEVTTALDVYDPRFLTTRMGGTWVSRTYAPRSGLDRARQAALPSHPAAGLRPGSRRLHLLRQWCPRGRRGVEQHRTKRGNGLCARDRSARAGDGLRGHGGRNPDRQQWRRRGLQVDERRGSWPAPAAACRRTLSWLCNRSGCDLDGLRGHEDHGVFKSTDGGTNWTATGLTTNRVFTLVVDPGTPATVYAGTGSGVFKSTDGAATWTAVTSGTGAQPVFALAIDPGDALDLYAGTANNGIFRISMGPRRGRPRRPA